MGFVIVKGSVADTMGLLAFHHNCPPPFAEERVFLDRNPSISLLATTPEKSAFDKKIDDITTRIQEDFTDEDISNWPGRQRRTREIFRNKFYGGIVIGGVVLLWYLLEAVAGKFD